MYQNHLAKAAHQPLPYPNVEAPSVVAPAWRSFHNYGIAADMTPANPADYPRMWDMANQFGLTPLRQHDMDHFQLSGTLDQNIKQYNLAGWRPDARPAPETGAIAYNGGPPAGQPPPNLVARGTPTTYNNPAIRLDSTGGGPAAQHEAFIRDYAAKIGINPDQAVAIAKAEGLNSTGFRSANQASTVDVSGGQPFSFGDFQLNVKGGMGADALKAGIDPSDPKQWQAADQYALDQMKQHGVGAWTDPAARAITAHGGLTLNTPQPGAVASGPMDPSAQAHGSTVNPPIPDATAPAAPAAPGFGQAIASGDVGGALKAALTKPTTTDAQGNQAQGKSPADKLADAIAPAAKQAPQIPEVQQAAPAQDPDPGLAPAASQLFQTVQTAAARPLTWSSRPYGSNAGFQGTTLNATGYGGNYG